MIMLIKPPHPQKTKDKSVQHRWRRAWRRGFGPRMATNSLLALRGALLRDDPRLLQGQTSSPPATEIFFAERIEGCCALSFGAWQTGQLPRVRELADYYENLCQAADRALGEPAACVAFLDWYDQTPRSRMRRLLLREVNRLLNRRGSNSAPAQA